MGVHSTVDLTREEAVRLILDSLDDATNDELAEALYALFGDRRLDNYRVYDSHRHGEAL